MVPTKHQYILCRDINYTIFQSTLATQSREQCVCQSRDLESVHVHSAVKCSMFKAQTDNLSPPTNPYAYCIIHKTSIDDCIRGLQLFSCFVVKPTAAEISTLYHIMLFFFVFVFFCIHIQAETRHKVIKNIINGLTTVGIHHRLWMWQSWPIIMAFGFTKELQLLSVQHAIAMI